jgi:hypothetical protein
VHSSIDADFRPAPDLRPVKHGCPSGDENVGFDLRADHVAVGTDYAVVSNATVMATGGPDHRILEHDAIPPDADGPAGLRHQTRSVHDPAACIDGHIAANRRLLRDPGIGID